MSEAGRPAVPSSFAAANIALVGRMLSSLGSEEVFAFFADDVVFEYPYAPSLGIPDRLEGKAAVVAHIRSLLTQLTGLTARGDGRRVLPDVDGSFPPSAIWDAAVCLVSAEAVCGRVRVAI